MSAHRRSDGDNGSWEERRQYSAGLRRKTRKNANEPPHLPALGGLTGFPLDLLTSEISASWYLHEDQNQGPK